MDFLSLEPDRSNTKDILVLTDHFTKYAVAMPTRNQKAQTVAKCLWENFFVHYGFPERILSDQGRDFESHTIKELCRIAGIQKVRTTPYHPRGNPVERFNRTLLQMLGTLENKDKSHWREFVKPLVHAYNCTRNDVTGFSPYELMFGRQPRLPVDLAFGLPVSSPPKSHSHYVHDLKDRLEESYRVAIENSSKIAQRNKLRFDKRVIDSALEPGDRVLVRSVRLRGKHKLADKWESDIYIVVKRADNLSVYTVRPEGQEGPLRTLHRDLLLPCGFLPVAESEESPEAAVNRPKTRQQSTIEVSDEADLSADHSDSEDQDEYYLLEHTSNNELIETRILTQSEPVPPERQQIKGKEQHTCIDELYPAPAELRLDDALTQNEIPVEEETMELSESEESDSPEIEVAAIVPTENEIFPEPNIMDESLPVFSDLSFSDSSVSDEISNSNESGQEVPVEGTEAELLDEETNLSSCPPGSETPIRRSQRHRAHPERFQYSQLGNPLLSIAQSFVQSLNVAFADALQRFSYDDALTKAMLSQSCGCNGTYTPLRGEGVTQVTMPLK